MQPQLNTILHRSTDIARQPVANRPFNCTNVPSSLAKSSTDAATVSERIATLRKRANLSQAALAKAASISREAIGKYERGESSPSVDIASRIAAALEVSLDYLVAGTTSELDDLDDDIIARARELSALADDERRPVLAVLDAYLRDVRIRRAYA